MFLDFLGDLLPTLDLLLSVDARNTGIPAKPKEVSSTSPAAVTSDSKV